MNLAVITGAASGIGLALSQVCLHRGHMVVMVDKDENKLLDEVAHCLVSHPNQVMGIACNVTKAEEVLQLAHNIMDQFGRVDWIYNNAGIMSGLAPIWDLKIEQIHQVMDVNLYGIIHMTQAFMPYLLKQNFRSHIINMASMYALCSGSQMAAYAMSKHAVLALSVTVF